VVLAADAKHGLEVNPWCAGKDYAQRGVGLGSATLGGCSSATKGRLRGRPFKVK
jgi:hypothetical protein